MTEQFDTYERIYRAVYPPEIMPMFWKENGEISSAVFKDKRGLSVGRAGDRDEEYLPTKRSIYHSEIHGDKDRIILSQSQCKYLAKRAKVCV